MINFRFELHEDLLEKTLAAVPTGMKVSVVSVVGAFRTGKSFFLDLCLRYFPFFLKPDPLHTRTHTHTHTHACSDAQDFSDMKKQPRMPTFKCLRMIRTCPGFSKRLELSLTETIMH